MTDLRALETELLTAIAAAADEAALESRARCGPGPQRLDLRAPEDARHDDPG